MDSESECEYENVGECFYFNNSKIGCPRRNQCGYVHRAGISTISGKARFYVKNAPIEKPMETPEWKQRERTLKRKWGDEKVDEVSEMTPAKLGPNTIIVEYLGDESMSTIHKEKNGGTNGL